MQQRGGLSSASLLDHLVKEPILVLQQHIWLVILPDPAGVQNLQSHQQCWVCVCVCVCLCEAHHLYTLLLRKQTFQLFLCWVMHADGASWMGGKQQLSAPLNHPFERDSYNSKHRCLSPLEDNERSLWAAWKSTALTPTDWRSARDLAVYLSWRFSGSGVVLSQIQQSHLQDTGENNHHFSVVARAVQATQRIVPVQAVWKKTAIISQTNFNKLDPLNSGNEQFVIVNGLRECSVWTSATVVRINSWGTGDEEIKVCILEKKRPNVARLKTWRGATPGLSAQSPSGGVSHECRCETGPAGLIFDFPQQPLLVTGKPPGRAPVRRRRLTNAATNGSNWHLCRQRQERAKDQVALAPAQRGANAVREEISPAVAKMGEWIKIL